MVMPALRNGRGDRLRQKAEKKQAVGTLQITSFFAFPVAVRKGSKNPKVEVPKAQRIRPIL
jgi:hypothetical protein